MQRHHPFAGDELFRRIIEDEVDRADPSMHPERRMACIRTVAERLAGDIEEHLRGADLFPDILIARLREEVAAAIGGEPGALAA
jgi:hypothetical protein